MHLALRVNAIGLDGAVFAFGLGITTLIGLGVGLIPALYVSGDNLQDGLHQSTRRTAGGHQVTRRTLVVAEVALALVLLVSSGLLLRSLQRLFAVAPGFDSSHVLTMQVQTSGRRFDDATTTYRFYGEALDAVRRVPGVAGAAFTSQLPLSGDRRRVWPSLRPERRRPSRWGCFSVCGEPGLLSETMGIPLRRGRLLDAHDTTGTPPSCSSMNRSPGKFRGENPVGRRVQVGPRPWYTIVGVVGDVKQTSLAVSQSDAVYVTPAQGWFADDAHVAGGPHSRRRGGAGSGDQRGDLGRG